MILITGGAGYIGSHLVLRLLNEGHDVIVYDNLQTSTLHNLKNIINSITKKSNFYFVRGDVVDKNRLEKVFKSKSITKVIHLAGLKSVNESFEDKERYSVVNISGSKVVFDLALKYDVQTIIFSSTATVYQPLRSGNYSETNSVTDDNSHYSHTKLEIERYLQEIKSKDKTIDIVIFRYFNPVGLDVTGIINGMDASSNLFPTIFNKIRTKGVVEIYGNDYLTHDGTAVRDYVHITDLVNAHMLVINDIVLSLDVRLFNLGSAVGYSVYEIVSEFNRQLREPVRFVYKPRRAGDVPMMIADISRVKSVLNWTPTYTLEDMVKSVL